MKHLPTSSPALALLAPVMTLACTDAVDAASFLKIEGIDGESTDERHGKWIEIQSFSWGVGCEADAAAGGVTPKTIDLVFVKWIDKSSPILMLNACTGKALESDVTLVFNHPERNGGEDYIKLTFHKVEIREYRTGATSGASATGGEPLPTESVSLNFDKVTFEYLPADGGEPVVVTRDFSESAPAN